MSIGTTSNMQWLVGNGGGGSVEYTGGHGIDVDNVDHIISVDQSEIQDKLTAGEGITIQNNVISANPQRQSDWTQTDTDAVDYIRNKPTIPTATSDLTNDSNFITASEVPSSQVQSDWNESDSSDPAYIANKPTIPSGDQLVPSATSSDEGKILTVDSNGDPSWAPAQTYSQVQSNWNETDSSAVSFIQNKPSIPTATSDLTNDSNFITASDVPGAQVQSDWTESDSSSPAYIAHKPTVDQSYSSSSTNAQSGTAVAQAISGIDEVPDVTSSDAGKVLVATYSGGTGSYEWVSNPPANAIILDYNSTWSDFHTAYSTGRKDIYYKHTSPFPPFDSRAEVYLQMTAVSDVDGSSSNFTFAVFEGSWQSGGELYAVICKIRYSGNPLVFINALSADQTYSSSSIHAQSGLAVAQAISSINQVPSSTSADDGKILTVDSNGAPTWATGGGSTQVQSNWTESNTSAPAYIQNKPTVKNLIAGTGIRITETAQGIVISLA